MRDKEVLIKGTINVSFPAWEYNIYEDKVGILTGPGYSSQFVLDPNREVAFQKTLRVEYFEDGEAARRIVTGNILADYIYLESEGKI